VKAVVLVCSVVSSHIDVHSSCLLCRPGGVSGLVAGGGSGSGGGGDSSNSTPSSHSSTNSSQDSLHKPPPKKKSGGLKTSIGRIFSSKKEKPNKDTPNRGYHTLPASTKSK